MSTHLDCVAAVVAKVTALQLTKDGLSVEVGSGNLITVYNKLLPLDDASRSLPYLLICPFGRERHIPGDGGSDFDVVQYPVLIGTIATGNRGNGPAVTTPTLYYGWRETASDAFMNKRLEGGPANVDFTWVEFLDVVPPNPWFDFNLYAGGFIAWCNARRHR